MKRVTVTCGSCAGIGCVDNWFMVSTDDITGVSTMQRETKECDCCNGKGWTEYAVFSIEEAKTILKHCGLSTESF